MPLLSCPNCHGNVFQGPGINSQCFCGYDFATGAMGKTPSQVSEECRKMYGDLTCGYPLLDPPIVVPWGTRAELDELLSPYPTGRHISNYFELYKCRSLRGFLHDLGLCFQAGDRTATLRSIQLFREYDDYDPVNVQDSFNRFHDELSVAFGRFDERLTRDNTVRGGNRWISVPGATILNVVYVSSQSGRLVHTVSIERRPL